MRWDALRDRDASHTPLRQPLHLVHIGTGAQGAGSMLEVSGGDMHSFSSDGVRIAYIDVAPQGGPEADRGEPILLIHGFASNHAVNWVNTMWVTALSRAGRRVIALDNRGHGKSEKLYDPAAYDSYIMAEDAIRLLDHLDIARADVMGYSMGARISAHLALVHSERVRALLLGGLGIHLVEGGRAPRGNCRRHGGALHRYAHRPAATHVPRLRRAGPGAICRRSRPAFAVHGRR